MRNKDSLDFLMVSMLRRWCLTPLSYDEAYSKTEERRLAIGNSERKILLVSFIMWRDVYLDH